MRKKPFLAFVQIMGKKVYETCILGAEMGKTGEGSAFYVQIELNHKTLIFNTLHKKTRIFCAKTFALPCILQNFLQTSIYLII